MPPGILTSPLTFTPLFQERVWGGRRLAELFEKKLPTNKPIGESWEIVDRAEAQSVVSNGPLKGKTLHELWTQDRQEIFGESRALPRFPLLIKLLDAENKLSLQVHPPDSVATELGGEAKTEFWYVAHAEPGAELFVGFKNNVTRDGFAATVKAGKVADLVHRVPVKTGDAMFLPAGRFHGIGAGCVLVEIQQNSDTTYRVFDWERKDRQLHLEQALRCIDFDDVAPGLVRPEGELLVRDELFEIQKWRLNEPREAVPRGQFAIVCCLTGAVRCADVDLAPGDFALVPAHLQDRQVHPRAGDASLLRVTIPK